MPLKRIAFAAISFVVVALMYFVPFYGLKGTVGPETLLFWVLISLAYLAIAILALRGES
jgi:multidrug efflux pump subunit AcrB